VTKALFFTPARNKRPGFRNKPSWSSSKSIRHKVRPDIFIFEIPAETQSSNWLPKQDWGIFSDSYENLHPPKFQFH
jgi:hypothetical protein